jgi:hypothetical protein
VTQTAKVGDIATPCTRAYDWTGEHLFENYEIELDPDGYDEYERCGLPADHPLHVEGAHAAALRRQESDWYERAYRKAVGIDSAAPHVGNAMTILIDEDHAEAVAEHYYRLAREIADAGKIFPPAARDMARAGRYADALTFIYSWRADAATARQTEPESPSVNHKRWEVLSEIVRLGGDRNLPMPMTIDFTYRGGVDLRLNNDDPAGVDAWTAALNNGPVESKPIPGTEPPFTSYRSTRYASQGSTWLDLDRVQVWSALYDGETVDA